jgi:hypothetical protein
MIAGGAGAAVLAALGYRAWDRGAFTTGEGPAFEAWKDWQGHAGEDPARRPLHAAILASSAHNTQPWAIELHSDEGIGSISIRPDLSRNIGAADPFRRELYTSIGCAVENLEWMLQSTGYQCETYVRANRLAPNPPPRVVDLANTEIQARIPPSELAKQRASAIVLRHTNRGAYRHDHALPRELLTPVVAGGTDAVVAAAAVTDPGARKELGALIVEATERFIADPEMSRDSGRWFRTGRHDIELHRDGVTTETAGLSPFMTGMAKMLPDQDTHNADQYWLSGTRDVQVPTTPAYVILFCSDRLFSLSAVSIGRSWQRMHLDATLNGLAAQPMNAPIEMMDRDYLLGRKNEYAKELRKIVGAPDGADPAFIFRLGYAERPAVASPRRRLSDVIITKA